MDKSGKLVGVEDLRDLAEQPRLAGKPAIPGNGSSISCKLTQKMKVFRELGIELICQAHDHSVNIDCID